MFEVVIGCLLAVCDTNSTPGLFRLSVSVSVSFNFVAQAKQYLVVVVSQNTNCGKEGKNGKSGYIREFSS